MDAAAPHLTADLVRERDEAVAMVDEKSDMGHAAADAWQAAAEQAERERDEALAEVQRLHNRIAVVFAEGLAEKAEAEAAVARVEALHTPLERRGHTECAACQDTSDWMYPCATVRALRGDQ